MAENSKIEWTDHTFNPWIGCTKVSPGCANCYAEAQDKFRRWTPEGWGKGMPRKRTSAAAWKLPLKWDIEAGERRTRPRVFCASLADWLDEEVPVEWRTNLLELIHATPNLDWLLLTKRPQNWRDLCVDAFEFACDHGRTERHHRFCDWLGGWAHADIAPQNVWIGATVEDQPRAAQRVPALIEIPARVRFLSCEPLLGQVNIADPLGWTGQGSGLPSPLSNALESLPDIPTQIHWVICGGESGPGARPSHPNWFRGLRDQCEAAKVPFLFKQWGEWTQRSLLQIKGKPYGGGADYGQLDPRCERWPDVIRLGEHGKSTLYVENCTADMGEELYVQRVGKKRAGRLLDGREWNEFPQVA